MFAAADLSTPPGTEVSLLAWIFNSLGFAYSVLLPLLAVVGFVLTLIIVLRGQGPLAAAALLLIVHMPLLVGAFAALQGMMASFLVIAISGTAPKPAEVAEGISTALVAPFVSLLLIVPAYLTATIGGFIRCLRSSPPGPMA